MFYLGMDVGTMFVAAAKPASGNSLSVVKKRNCFIIIKGNKFNQQMYTKNTSVDWMPWEGGDIALIGDSAMGYANSAPTALQVRRPLKKGILNKTEKDAYPMLCAIVESVAGTAPGGGTCTLSIPAPTIDVEYLVDHHRDVLLQILGKLGWRVQTVHEGYCVILSSLAESQFTGIGISFGGGMVNCSFSFLAEEMFAFSMQKSGDWVDQVASESSRFSVPEITDIKETRFSLDEDNIGKDGAWQIESAYQSLIEATVENICVAFESLERPPRVKDPLPVAIAGGTSMVPGFAKRFEERLRASRFPVPIGRVFSADDPLFAVCKGALLHAQTAEDEPAEVAPAPEPQVQAPVVPMPQPEPVPAAHPAVPQIPAGFRPTQSREDKK